MTNLNLDQIVINAHQIEGKRASDHVALVFGNFSVICENMVFTMTEKHWSEYKGGQWNMYRLTNDGFYMSPRTDAEEDTILSQSPFNGSEEELSADAFGIAMCLMAYSQVSFTELRHGTWNASNAFHKLRDFALRHKEADKIFSIID